MIKTLSTKLSYLFIIFLGFLIACSPVTSPAIAPTTPVEELPTTTPVPTFMPLPTSAHNILELGSASQLPLPDYKQECLNVLRPNPGVFTQTLQNLAVEGVAVFIEYVNDRATIALLDLQSGEKHTIPEDLGSTWWADGAEISPDGNWLFYLAGRESDMLGNSSFVLANSNGIKIKELSIGMIKHRGFSYEFVHEWLGNDSLRLLSKKDYRDDDLIVLLLDPFSEEITQLQNDFESLQPPVVKRGKNPNGSPNNQYLDWGVDPFLTVIAPGLNGANVAYSPDKNVAFYPHKDGYDVLYDVQNQKELAQVLIPNWGELPRWSSTGEDISIIATPPNFSSDNAKKDFYLLSGDGRQLRRLTYLSEQFERVSIKEYSWSPDGTKIAFWLNTNFPLSEDEEVPYELAIVEVATGNVTNLCVTNPNVTVKKLAEKAGFLRKPVWSQNSNDLLVEIPSIDKGDGFYTETILVVPSKLTAIAMMKYAQLKGWMVNEP